MALKQYLGTGRRKTSVARVFLRSGTGNIVVNGKPLDEYFNRKTEVACVEAPFKVVDMADRFDAVNNTLLVHKECDKYKYVGNCIHNKPWHAPYGYRN